MEDVIGSIGDFISFIIDEQGKNTKLKKKNIYGLKSIRSVVTVTYLAISSRINKI